MRAQVVLLDGGRILLARHETPTRTYWVLPGGRIEDGEAPEDAAVRELAEETGLQVRIERLLYVDEPQTDGAETIHEPRYTFLASVVGGEFCQIPDPGEAHVEKGRLVGADWMEFDSPLLDARTQRTLDRVRQSLTEVEQV